MFNISIDVNGVNGNLLKGALQSFFLKISCKDTKKVQLTLSIAHQTVLLTCLRVNNCAKFCKACFFLLCLIYHCLPPLDPWNNNLKLLHSCARSKQNCDHPEKLLLHVAITDFFFFFKKLKFFIVFSLAE